MRVLLVFTHIDDRFVVYYPFGLASIFSSVAAAGHQVEGCLVFHEADRAAFCQKLEIFKPQVVGFSTVSSQFIHVKKLLDDVKRADPSIVTVCGGVHPTIFPDILRESPSLDAIFRGEAEEAFLEFLECLAANRPWHGVDNLGYLADGAMRLNTVKPLAKPLDQFPLPEKKALGYFESIKAGNPAEFLFSRGCPFCCHYCSNHALAAACGRKSNRPRFLSPEKCLEDISLCLARVPHPPELMFWDDVFGLDKNWRQEFLSKYKKRFGLPFTCMLHPLQVTRELARELKHSGCRWVRMGLETGNEKLRRETLNRPVSDQRLIKAFGLLQEAGIKTYALSMIGLPGEDLSTLRQTVEMNRTIAPDDSVVQIFHPYHGCRLGDRCFAEGLVDLAAYGATSDERTTTCLRFSPEIKELLPMMRYQWHRLIYHHREEDPVTAPVPIDPGAVRHLEGAAYQLELEALRPAADTPQRPYHSLFFVYENGRRLGPPHSPLDKIRQPGKGRFSHREGRLVFSASDNGHPGRNGRVYELRHLPLVF